MAQKLTAAIPADMDLDQTYMVAFTAVDPATGATASGVNVSQASLLVGNLTSSPASALQSGPFQLIPLDDLTAG